MCRSPRQTHIGSVGDDRQTAPVGSRRRVLQGNVRADWGFSQTKDVYSARMVTVRSGPESAQITYDQWVLFVDGMEEAMGVTKTTKGPRPLSDFVDEIACGFTEPRVYYPTRLVIEQLADHLSRMPTAGDPDGNASDPRRVGQALARVLHRALVDSRPVVISA